MYRKLAGGPGTEQEERREQDEEAVPEEPDGAEPAVQEQAEPDGRLEQRIRSSRDHHHLVRERREPREQDGGGQPAREPERERGPRVRGRPVAAPGEEGRAEDPDEAEPADQMGPARRQAEGGHSEREVFFVSNIAMTTMAMPAVRTRTAARMATTSGLAPSRASGAP